MSIKKDVKDLIQEFNNIFNNKYDYSKFQYINAHSKGIIICPYHGEFLQDAHSHKKGHGCKKCADKSNHETSKHPINDFIKKCNIVHNNYYDYSKIQYVSNKTKIIIICPKHGEFKQIPLNHLYKQQGCPKCRVNYSKGEQLIEEWLKDNNIDYITQYRFDNCVFKRKMPFDFYLPSFNTCIEFDGLQHFEPIYGNENLELIKIKDKMKTDFCLNNKINLLRITYIDRPNINDILTKHFL